MVIRIAALSALIIGCIAPRPLGLARVSVCALAEMSRSDYLARPTLSRGGSVCADFEPAPEPESATEPEAVAPEESDAGL